MSRQGTLTSVSVSVSTFLSKQIRTNKNHSTMAHTLTPDPELQRFNKAKEAAGTNFRFKPKSVAFNLITMGLIPLSLGYYLYSVEGWKMNKLYRSKPVFINEYQPRQKDL